MRIVPIFATQLSAFHYANESSDEFQRLFNNWQDPQYLFDFFSENDNQEDLKRGYYSPITIEDAMESTLELAKDLKRRLTIPQKNEGFLRLDEFFRPLVANGDEGHDFQRNKLYQKWLRIYALKIDDNVYAITGGAIKLTQHMQDRHHTNFELGRLERCRSYLEERGITDLDGFHELCFE